MGRGTGGRRGKGGRRKISLLAKLVSPFAWLIVTLPNGELARRLVGVLKGWKVGEIGGNHAQHETAQYCAIEKGEGGTEGRRFGTPASISRPRAVILLSSDDRGICGKRKSKLCKLMKKRRDWGGESFPPRSSRLRCLPLTRALDLLWFKRKIRGCLQFTPPPPPPPIELSYLRPGFVWIINILVLFISVVRLSFYYI